MKKILNSLNEKQRREHYIKKHHQKIYNNIIKFKNELEIELNSFSQLLFHFVYDIKEIPKCKICDKNVNFYNYNRGYKIYCSRKCSMNDIEVIKKRNKKSIKTNIKKYGVDNPMKNKEIVNKMIQTNKDNHNGIFTLSNKEFREKIKLHNKKKYNKEYYFQTDEFFEKKLKTCLQKYNIDNYTKISEIKNKSKNTKKKKYNDKNYNNRKKSEQTCLKKYGKKHHMIYKKENNLLQDFYSNLSLKYYQNIITNKYKIIDINNNNIELIHSECNKTFKINKQLLYLRNKFNLEICTHCNSLNKPVSNKEKELLNFIKKNYTEKIIKNSRKIINPYELDIYLPDLNLAFEFNGLYWHNELNKENKYHLMKTNLCENKNIQLIHIWEDNWLYKQEIVKSMILNKLGKTKNKIMARKCEIKEIDNNKLIRQFLDENHLQGFVGSRVKIGLFYQEKLVSLMTFGKKRIAMNSSSKENEYELLRFCNKLNTTVIGGASRLFKYFLKEYIPVNITTYADRSYSNGNLYEKLGFKFVHKTQPNYYYIIDRIRKHRFNFRKDKLIKERFDKNMTEHQIMLERKIYRIYDSGSLKFIWDKYYEFNKYS